MAVLGHGMASTSATALGRARALPKHPLAAVEAGGVALVAERGDLLQQGVELQQRVPIRPGIAAHSGVAATRSGLTCSLRNAPSE